MDQSVTFSNWGDWSKGAHTPPLPEELGRGKKLRAFMGWDGLVLKDGSVNIVDMCRAYMLRAREESCGQCFPCRLGTEEMSDILERICQGRGSPGDLDRLEELAHLVKDTSKCGIGETAPRPILDALKHFRDHFVQAVESGQAIPKGSYVARVTAPCMDACPSHVNIPSYVEKIRLGQFKEALEVVRQDCPLPGTIGRVCVRPCEFNCRRTKLDEPIAIKALKRFIADHELSNGQTPEFEPAEPKSDRVAIIGAGPAGLSCAIYLGLLGYRSTIFESLPEPGGMAAVGIPDYRLPRKILRYEASLAEKLGAEIRYNVTMGEDITRQDLQREGFRAIFVGAGAPESSKMRCEGEDAGYQCFMTGVEFLRLIAQGKKPLEGRKMVVIGGGNVAMDCVRSALRTGFTDVNLVYRRTEKEMPADPVEIKEAKEEGVQFHYLIQPVRIHADQGKVSGLECMRMELGEPDDSGRRRPVAVEGSNFVLECDAIIPAIGQTCVVDCVLPDEEGIELTRWKTLVVDELTYQSKDPHIFGGGDCITGPDTLIRALAAGKNAARHIAEYLRKGSCEASPEECMDQLFSRLKVFYPMEKTGVRAFDKRARQKALEPEERIQSFEEVEAGFSKAEALHEASRCLRCYRIGLAAV
jgi:formate dehydrogenase beta subunit